MTCNWLFHDMSFLMYMCKFNSGGFDIKLKVGLNALILVDEKSILSEEINIDKYCRIDKTTQP